MTLTHSGKGVGGPQLTTLFGPTYKAVVPASGMLVIGLLVTMLLAAQEINVLAKAWAYYCELGMRALLRRIRRGIFHRDRYVILLRELGDEEWPSEYDDVRFRLATEADVSWMSRQWPESLGYVGRGVEGVLRARLEAGEIAIVGTLPGDAHHLAFMTWLSFRDHTLMTFFGGTVPPGEVCSKNLVVTPALRRRGIARRGQRYAETVARERGARRIWGFALPANTVSIKLHEGIGYRVHGEICFVEELGHQYATIAEDDARRVVPLRSIKGHVL